MTLTDKTMLSLLRRTEALTGPLNDPRFHAGRLALSPEGALAIASHLLLLAAEHRLTHLGAEADGGMPLMAQAVMLSAARKGDHPLLRGYYRRTEVKDHGTMSRIEGHPPTAGDRAAVLAEVTSTGNALLQSAEAAMDADAEVPFLFAAVEDGPQARRTIEARGHRLVTLYRIN